MMYSIDFIVTFITVALIMSGYISSITFEKKYSKNKTIILLSILILSIITIIYIINYFFDVPPFTYFIIVSVLALPMALFYNNNFYSKAFLINSILLFQLLILTVSILLVYIISGFKFEQSVDVLSLYFIYVSYCIFSLLSLVLFMRDFSRKFMKLRKIISQEVWRVYSLLPIIAGIYLSTVYLNYSILELDFKSFGTSCFVISLIIYLYYLFDSLFTLSYEKARQQSEKETYKIMEESQRNYYEMLNRNVEESRYFRHDLKHNLLVMNTLVNDNDIDNLKEYINILTNKINDTIVVRYTKNNMFNAILSHYEQYARKNNVNIKLDIKVAEFYNIDNHDLCMVVGNLFENAIEACIRDEKAQKEITLNINEVNDYIVIFVKNSYDGHVKKEKNKFLSSKLKGGIGLQSVTNIISKYSGDIDISYDNFFTVKVALKIIKDVK